MKTALGMLLVLLAAAAIAGCGPVEREPAVDDPDATEQQHAP